MKKNNLSSSLAKSAFLSITSHFHSNICYAKFLYQQDTILIILQEVKMTRHVYQLHFINNVLSRSATTATTTPKQE